MYVEIGAAVAAGAVLGAWYAAARRVDAPCHVDLESTHDHFHAHAHVDGVLVNEGDAVTVHRAPTHIPFGTRQAYSTTATVEQASALKRAWTRLVGRTHITELYEVGFEG